MFFSFDGIDGAGKSTQSAMFCQWLRERGHQVVACRDPGSTALGDHIRRLLLEEPSIRIDAHAEMLLYMGARAQLVEEVIRPALAAGNTVVSDRYLLANIVYQGYAGGLDPEEIRRVGTVATGGLMPTLTVVLDAPPETAQGRLARPLDRMESRGATYRQALRDGFLAEARRYPREIVVVDADQPHEQVQAEIRRIADRFLGASR